MQRLGKETILVVIFLHIKSELSTHFTILGKIHIKIKLINSNLVSMLILLKILSMFSNV